MSARVTLTIAGSDPGGGAGIQADLKTFGALGTFGTSVVTALTAQNTRGVAGVHPVPAAFVRQQLDVLLEDITVHATKIGMLPGPEVVRTVVEALADHPAGPVVLDPVMVATSGDRLSSDDAVAALRDDLVPLADLVTPNVAEAAMLLGTTPARGVHEAVEQAEELLRRSGTAVLLKGGHLVDGAESVDVLAEPGRTRLTSRPRVDTTGTHGTGCTLSSAITAKIAVMPMDDGWLPFLESARDYLQGTLLGGRTLDVGHGNGPLDHFYWALGRAPAKSVAGL